METQNQYDTEATHELHHLFTSTGGYHHPNIARMQKIKREIMFLGIPTCIYTLFYFGVAHTVLGTEWLIFTSLFLPATLFVIARHIGIYEEIYRNTPTYKQPANRLIKRFCQWYLSRHY